MFIGILFVVVLGCGPLVAVFLTASEVLFFPVYGVTAAFALLSFGFLCTLPLLSGRYRLMERFGGIGFWYRWHMAVPGFLILALIAHYLVRLAWFGRGSATVGGELAFWLLVFGSAVAALVLGLPWRCQRLLRLRETLRLRLRLPYRIARLVHNLLLLSILLATLHASSSSLGQLVPVRTVILAYGCGGLVLGLWPKLRRRVSGAMVWGDASQHGPISCYSLFTARPLRFRPGQYGFFRLRGRDATGRSLDGEPHPFSFTSLPGAKADAALLAADPAHPGYRAEICVKALGDFTAYLQRQEPPLAGSWEGPFGSFVPPEGCDLLLLAGGIGITPFLSWFEHFRQAGLPGTTRLLWSVKTADEVFCKGRIDAFAALPGARAELHESGPDDSRRLTAADLARHLEGLERPRVYLCGPPAFMAACRGFCRQAGIADRRIIEESFSL